jgi:hypothetical protein
MTANIEQPGERGSATSVPSSRWSADDQAEYEQINENVRALADVRFKLLALLPIAGGIAVALMAEAAKGADIRTLTMILAGSVLGFLLTLGITLYDQRNSELYNALIHRARHLERRRAQPPTPGYPQRRAAGGQFVERPGPSRSVFFLAKHDIALSLIYGALLGAWWHPFAYALAVLAHGGATGLDPQARTHVVALFVAAVAILVFTLLLLKQDARDADAYRSAAERDGL